MSESKDQEIHIHHHYAAPKARVAKKKKSAPGAKKTGITMRKYISVAAKIMDQLMRLAK